MKSRFALGPVVRLLAAVAGGRPAVVLPLAQAMDRAAQGQTALLREKSRRSQRLTPGALRLLILGLIFALSGFIALTMLVRPEDIHPAPGVIILVAFHWLMVLNMVLAQAGPALLVDEDHLVLGAWPVTRREIVLARLSAVLREAFEATAAMSVVPLIVYLVVGRPPALPALALLVGIVLQTVGVTFGLTAVLMLLVRRLGRKRAQRLAALVADGNFPFLLFLLMMGADRILPFVQAHPRVLAALPPAWFAAWGDLAAGPFYWLLAGVGLVTSAALVWGAVRLLNPSVASGADEDAGGGASRFDPGGWFAAALTWLLAPSMPGREGRVLRQLLTAHLREDVRFVAGLISIPAVLAGLFFLGGEGALREVSPEILQVSALSAVRYSNMIFVLGVQLLAVASFSSRPQALWIVALSDLDGARLLAAQRGMVRGLIMLPIGIVYFIKALEVGASWPTALRDLMVVMLELELIVVVMQGMRRTMPFSLAFTRDQSMRRLMTVMLYMAGAIGFALLNVVYARVEPVRWVMWAALPVAAVLGNVILDRRLRGAQLDMTGAVT